MSELNKQQLEKCLDGKYDTTILIKKGDVSFNRKTKKFAAEASTLSANGQHFTGKLLSIVTLKNEVTKRTMTFMCNGPQRDDDMDVTHWEYKPCKDSEANAFGVKGFIIFND